MPHSTQPLQTPPPSAQPMERPTVAILAGHQLAQRLLPRCCGVLARQSSEMIIDATQRRARGRPTDGGRRARKDNLDHDF